MTQATILNVTPYGTLPAGPPEDVSNVWTYSVDLRRLYGGEEPDESCWLEPGTVPRALFPTAAGTYPVGEVRMLHAGVEIRVVADLTGRPGELTLDMLRTAMTDPAYRETLNAWVAGLAS